MFLSSLSVCVCGGGHRDHQPGPHDQSWRGMGGVVRGSVSLAKIKELLSVMFKFTSDSSPVSAETG